MPTRYSSNLGMKICDRFGPAAPATVVGKGKDVDQGRREIDRIFADWAEGAPGALDALIPHVYDELHRLAEGYLRVERSDHTLQATAMIHEAYLRLSRQRSFSAQDRTHFFALSARVMRRILVDHARRRAAAKRGGGWGRLSVEDFQQLPAKTLPVLDLLDLDEALERLAGFDPRKARVLELRYYAGLNVKETASVLGVSVETVHVESRLARAWLLELVGKES